MRKARPSTVANATTESRSGKMQNVEYRMQNPMHSFCIRYSAFCISFNGFTARKQSATMPPMKGETILVTGAAGFIGSHSAEALIERGYKVVGVDNFCDFYD